MPSHKRPKKTRTRGNRIDRGGPTMSVASGVARGASSIAKNTLGMPMKRPRKGNRLGRDKALRSMASSVASSVASGMSSVASGMSSVGQAAMPLAGSMAESVGQSVSKFVSDQMVPRVPNNPSWVNLKDGLEKGLIKLGLLDEDGEINPAIYFQSVERFLDIHKKTKINKDHINRVEMSFRSMPTAMLGDHTPETMGEYFGNGITRESIIKALNYGFHEILVDDLDMDLEPEPELEPGEGFKQTIEEKKTESSNRANVLRINKLKNGIELLMVLPEKEREKYYDSLILQYYKEIESLIKTDEGLKIYNELNKKYKLKELIETKGRQKKRTKHKKKKKKQTKRRKKK